LELSHPYAGGVCRLLIRRIPYGTTGYGLEDREVGVRIKIGSQIFSSSRGPDRLWGPPNIKYNGTGGGDIPPEVKRPGLEVDHSPPTSAEVKKMWIYTSTASYAFMA
jgi:hypothetical protein